MNGTLTDVRGITVGHWTDRDAATGCTVILCEGGAVAGVDVRGAAPGTRETDLLRPECLVERVNAILLGGGSAFGLAAADGVMHFLEERGWGFDVGVAKVPIVPAAILFDLAIGRADIRPAAPQGYLACQAATDGPVDEGSVGAGTGATVGKLLGAQFAMKGGLGSASLTLSNGVVVAALAAVNALGDVVDPATGKILAGTRQPGSENFLNSTDTMIYAAGRAGGAAPQTRPGVNTTLAVVATNAQLTKVQASQVARMAHDGLARAIRPVHTMFDGDTVFALSLGTAAADLSVIGVAAAEVVAQAIIRAVKTASSLHGISAWRDQNS
ncbi:MAG: peptidase S58 family protein [Chloroflexi bacterium]|nr:peptidase S58 family protein [Chloroflexota bacterium]